MTAPLQQAGDPDEMCFEALLHVVYMTGQLQRALYI